MEIHHSSQIIRGRIAWTQDGWCGFYSKDVIDIAQLTTPTFPPSFGHGERRACPRSATSQDVVLPVDHAGRKRRLRRIVDCAALLLIVAALGLSTIRIADTMVSQKVPSIAEGVEH